MESITSELVSNHDEKEKQPHDLICNFCEISFNTKSAIRMHIWRKHKQDKNREKEEFPSNAIYEHTLGSAVPMQAPIDKYGKTDNMMVIKDGIRKCLVCNKQAKRGKSDLTAHLETQLQVLSHHIQVEGARNLHVFRKHSAKAKV